MADICDIWICPDYEHLQCQIGLESIVVDQRNSALRNSSACWSGWYRHLFHCHFTWTTRPHTLRSHASGQPLPWSSWFFAFLNMPIEISRPEETTIKTVLFLAWLACWNPLSFCLSWNTFSKIGQGRRPSASEAIVAIVLFVTDAAFYFGLQLVGYTSSRFLSYLAGVSSPILILWSLCIPMGWYRPRHCIPASLSCGRTTTFWNST